MNHSYKAFVVLLLALVAELAIVSSSTSSEEISSPDDEELHRLESDLYRGYLDHMINEGQLDNDDGAIQITERRPSFIGKRSEDSIDKRRRPGFIGKRRKPSFIGKRVGVILGNYYGNRWSHSLTGRPAYLGKRPTPGFIGKRRPSFLGKRGSEDDDFLSVPQQTKNMFDAEENDYAKTAEAKRRKPGFIGKRSISQNRKVLLNAGKKKSM
ncbi:uncharacterized protein LOC141902365 isoform X1 [Tubulanus polymorphus]|uniref:uncharacterized protein LOC141902365 isoform X1 n=1 Tax=Tubulanus polymorphus TaxID=672921 RepID=UPI003DA66BAC